MTPGAVQRAMMEDEDYLDLLPSDLLVPHYLIHCYLYYELDAPLIPDRVFDALARRLDDEWREAKHRHRKLIDREALTSGGHYLKYPTLVKQSARSLLR